ncbi:hypothetical protein IT418_02720 [bacterium]|nr:hypothetical protein [bacterium]
MAEIRDYGHILNTTFARHILTAGTVTTGTFHYSNAFTSETTEVKRFTTLVAFIYQEHGIPTIYQVTPEKLRNYDMSSWVEVQEKEFQLKTGESIDIHYNINVPKDPQIGGKYAVIVIVPQEKLEELTGAGAKITANIGFPIIGRIAGTERINSEIISFRTDKSIYWYWPSKPIVFTTTVKNTGNVDYLAGGDIFVHTGDITTPLKEFTINESDLVILPNNTRSFQNEWKATEPLLSMKNNGVFINFEYFRFGKFTATAKIGYDVEGTRVVGTREASFWILPLPLIVAILTVIVVSSLVIIWKKRQKHRQKLVDKKSTMS